MHIGSETDFVAKNEEFIAAAHEIAEAADKAGADSKDAANAAALADGTTVGDKLGELAAKIGEKIELANAAHFDGNATCTSTVVPRTCPRRSASWSSTRATTSRLSTAFACRSRL
ncbi:translation elongation factor Ts [Cutibacterium acnes JCM 18909]|nr:translation elongation factor Ts [Cutibacterium acnes JCM 18909]